MCMYTHWGLKVLIHAQRFCAIGGECTLSDLSFNRWAMCMVFMCVHVWVFVNHLGLGVEMYVVYYSVCCYSDPATKRIIWVFLLQSFSDRLAFPYFLFLLHLSFEYFHLLWYTTIFFVTCSVPQMVICSFPLYLVFNSVAVQ